MKARVEVKTGVVAPLPQPLPEGEGGGGGMRYVGRGFVPGVPARDLTGEEVEVFGRGWLLGLRCPHTGGAVYVEEEQDSEEV